MHSDSGEERVMHAGDVCIQYVPEPAEPSVPAAAESSLCPSFRLSASLTLGKL